MTVRRLIRPIAMAALALPLTLLAGACTPSARSGTVS
ncbi:MAG: hypothetical protein QOH29_2166, partial [Actinomycetota bacterium]|nr:hypothetical protein [Actinomycetota bacterium]